MTAAANVVWVLGAGFSKSLGGPLLTDLFTHPRLDRLEARSRIVDDSTKRWSGALERFRQLTRFYRYEDTTFVPHIEEAPWSDPEQFVEMLDAAASPDGEWVTRVVGAQEARRKLAQHQTTARMAKDARQYLAAICHEFVPSPAPSNATERWRPYLRWGKIVAEDTRHTVLTFNYDRVVEIATGERLRPITPLTCVDSGGAQRFVKLHGSVDWALVRQGQAIERTDPYEAIAGDCEILIATPGASKASLSEATFRETWALAENALTEADVIVFVGYRFPESDAVAKTRVLGAIKRNERTGLTIRTVLGPKRGDDVERLDGLLRWSLSHRQEVAASKRAPIGVDRAGRVLRIVHERLWAEDFLTVFDPDALHAFTVL